MELPEGVGADDLHTARARLAQLERERGYYAGERRRLQNAVEASRPIEDESASALRYLEDVERARAYGTAQERRTVVRGFLAGINVDKRKQQAQARWYRLGRDAASTRGYNQNREVLVKLVAGARFALSANKSLEFLFEVMT